MEINKRRFIFGAGATLAVVAAVNIMPVRVPTELSFPLGNPCEEVIDPYKWYRYCEKYKVWLHDESSLARDTEEFLQPEIRSKYYLGDQAWLVPPEYEKGFGPRATFGPGTGLPRDGDWIKVME